MKVEASGSFAAPIYLIVPLLALGFILFVITFLVLAAARWMLARMQLKA